MVQPTEALVVDASVAAKWHLSDEADSDKALAILEPFIQGRLALLAPAHVRYEVASAIAVATIGREPRLTREQGQEAIAEFLATGIHLEADSALILAAYLLVHQYGCALYDALYLALAERLDLRFITADRRLYERVRHLPNVVWIDDYPLQ